MYKCFGKLISLNYAKQTFYHDTLAGFNAFCETVISVIMWHSYRFAFNYIIVHLDSPENNLHFFSKESKYSCEKIP